jgi:opacity protein-like surface antigen
MRTAQITLASLALGASMTVAATVAADAADMAGRAPIISDDSMIPQEIGTGWDLRGDVGLSENRKPGNYSYGSTDFTDTSVDRSFIGSIGVGYQFNDMFRADATVEWLQSYDLKGASTCATWTYNCATATDATAEATRVGAMLFMLNGYVDLASWNGLTPYVGAGIGVANVETGSHESTTAGSTAADRVFGGKDLWSLAGNVMAGASYNFGNGLMLDIGYRFLWIDNGSSSSETSGNESGWVTVHDLTAHQIRAGLRYYLY